MLLTWSSAVGCSELVHPVQAFCTHMPRDVHLSSPGSIQAHNSTLHILPPQSSISLPLSGREQVHAYRQQHSSGPLASGCHGTEACSVAEGFSTRLIKAQMEGIQHWFEVLTRRGMFVCMGNICCVLVCSMGSWQSQHCPYTGFAL